MDADILISPKMLNAIITFKNEHFEFGKRLKTYNAELFTTLEKTCSPFESEVNISRGNIIDIQNASLELDVTNFADAYVSVWPVFKEGHNDFYKHPIFNLINGIFWGHIMNFTCDEEFETAHEVPEGRPDVKRVSTALTECKKAFLQILNNVKNIDKNVYEQLIYLFALSREGKEIEANFFIDFVRIRQKIDVNSYMKVYDFLSRDSISIIHDEDWKVLKNLFQYIHEFFDLFLPTLNEA
ncbi:MAG: hypothetical protein COA43_13310 [Robiginitomaculum sp.]|nr:MAG: hypothetical protein COA43_13310 [Robiginitomaculum sp.]